VATLTFDTLKFANRLKHAGVPDKQAEAEAEALAEVFEANLKDLVTKADLQIAVAELRAEIVKWMVGLALAQIGLLVGILVKLL
jgi:hypothetical protein